MHVNTCSKIAVKLFTARLALRLALVARRGNALLWLVYKVEGALRNESTFLMNMINKINIDNIYD